MAFLMLFLFTDQVSYSQTDKKERKENLYTVWMKLAILGKNQAEIESYFLRKIGSEDLELVKGRIRNTVLDNLKRSGLESRIMASYDLDDLNVVIDRVLTEIRYVGLEHDQDLRQTIKEEFGITLERL
ncbi:MAG: hypothetical protein A2600_12470 [Candidatus Lambdaproteobacteria bacterium RIFOXYD1_FULL_56_27]|uniref:Uncharacterized protein n=1 Tax=Candidatus Lambdaproteobacteria bacterium RIFOXYD2_FULL_56_26 TaxID=1817773 RepID=A0A1F6GST5_9PROT|nr:MAG: hypothetical protein A2426_00075 [Candidatus Lambdaproteobacteria bacterium RIFOXYC1_FULL_56_13]OGH01184.1 MAG: hypothetical protein A2557_01565 [Candidatus Lambdaproteobacteria bacterium RIFOXYD2_FULL_56_26]OGH06454.1 MAG: hypothetical protein A2600_12470 [Candidatus Lambdaproteobacteria bacterium RIFOXYD1_FULL_56_27]